MTLELRDIWQNYEKKTIISGLNLVFKPGIYGLLGPNGAGKSTTIRMVCTVEKPSSGEIFYNGQNIYDMKDDYRERLGYVPQKAGYYPDFNAFMFLKYVAGLKGIEEPDKMIEKCLKMVGLWEAREKKLKKFSGGMKQRINIAQAMLNDPEIFILDEPTVGLDPNERMNLKNLLTELAENKIIILASHIVSDVEDIADRVIILKQGDVLLDEEIDVAMRHTEGKTWQCDLADMDEVNRIKKEYKVSSVKRHKGIVSMRVISDEKPYETAVEVEKSLEEVYLKLIGE